MAHRARQQLHRQVRESRVDNALYLDTDVTEDDFEAWWNKAEPFDWNSAVELRDSFAKAEKALRAYHEMADQFFFVNIEYGALPPLVRQQKVEDAKKAGRRAKREAKKLAN